jgi:hypothetical protein
LAENHPQDFAGAGAEGHADADFAGALRNRKRGDAGDPNARQKQRRRGERSGGKRHEFILRARLLLQVIESDEPGDRSALIHVRDCLANGCSQSGRRRAGPQHECEIFDHALAAFQQTDGRGCLGCSQLRRLRKTCL